MKKTFFTILALTISACSSTIYSFDQAKLDKIPFYQLCYNTYLFNKYDEVKPAAQAQINQTLIKNGVKQKHIDDALKGEVYINMHKCGLYIAKGRGIRNTTQTTYGTHIQHIYGSTYIYTDNAKITAIQY